MKLVPGYIPAIDTLRFFAFLFVFLLHISSLPGLHYLQIYFSINYISGVDFFFTLSGFLITYLISIEKNNTGTINGKNYFFRRSLRIWPLYFLGAGIGFLNVFVTRHFHIGQSDGYSPNPLFTFTFLENYRMIWLDNFPNGAPLRVLWSICVEEHFYLLWFLVFFIVPMRFFKRTLLFLWAIGILYRIWFIATLPNKVYTDIDVISKLDYFSAGGICGLLLIENGEKIKSFITRIPLISKCLIWAAIFGLFHIPEIISGHQLGGIILTTLGAVLYSFVLIAAISTNWFGCNTHSSLAYLGRISYGLYVFHTIILVCLYALANRIGLSLENSFYSIVFAFTALSLTIASSILSFKYFESPFLRLKAKYPMLSKQT